MKISRGGSKGLGYGLLEFIFPPIYALTVMPFTVQFFRRFVSPPAADVKLFNLLPLAQVHEFFLPLFVLALELISIRLAAAFWAGSNWIRRILVLGVFVGFQMFPTFSVYYDARVTDYSQQTASAQPKVDPAEVKRLQDDYVNRQQQNDKAAAQYNLQLANQERDKVRLQQQISDLQGSIESSGTQISNALDRARFPGTVAEREAAANEAQRLGKQVDQLRADQSQAQKELQQLVSSPPLAPTPPEPPSFPEARPQPLPFKSEVDFMISTLSLPTSILVFFVSLIFPIIVFGAGFMLAKMETGDYEGVELVGGPALLNLATEFRICSRLSPVQQVGFVEGLKPVVLNYFETLRSSSEFAAINTRVNLENQNELDLLQELAALKGQLFSSRLAKEAKNRLDTYIDHLIDTQLFQVKEV